jgi:Domain of unknown function (DUF4386)
VLRLDQHHEGLGGRRHIKDDLTPAPREDRGPVPGGRDLLRLRPPYVRARLYVPGDAATTAANVAADASLVRIGFVADMVQETFFLFVVLALSRLLQ